mgnify:CR=1 FL=1
MDEVKFVEAAATETAAVAVPKRKSKKAKIEPVAVDSFEPVNAPVVRLPEMKCGVVVYHNEHTGALGFEYEGRGYQIPDEGLNYNVGDPIDFMIVDGKVILGVV